MAAVKTKSAALITIVIVLAIILIVNLLSLNVFARWDITESKKYSISDTSRKTMQRLEDRLTVKVFFTEDLPAPHNSDRRYLRDLLDDFKAYSNGKLDYSFIDPNSEEGQDEANSYQLQPARFSIRGSTKAETILGYKAVVLTYGGKREVMPFIQEMNTFEYDFLRLVKKLMSPAKPRIAFITGHGELDMNTDITMATRLLQDDFEVVPLNTSEVDAIPDDLQALLIINPRQEYREKELYLLDQYIMRGGKAAFLMSDMQINQQVGNIQESKTGLEPLIEHYGVKLNSDYVVDKNCYRYQTLRQVQGGVIPENVEVPFYINIVHFNGDNALTRLQSSMILVGTSSLDTAVTLLGDVQREVLFTSTEKAGTVDGDIATKLRALTDADYNKSYIPLGVVLTGHFKSYFTARPVPQDTAVTDSLPPAPLPELVTDGQESRLLVIGSGNFFDDNAANDRYRRFQSNFIFFRNMVDWLTQDEDLIAIRAKGGIHNPFTKLVSDDAQTTIRMMNVFTVPILVIIFGLVRWQVRRSSKARRNL